MGTNTNSLSAGSVLQPTSNRRYPRLNIDISVRVFRDGAFATLGRGHDVSCCGMALYTPVELQIGEEIQLSFVLPYSRVQFGLRASVCNRDGFRYGVEFKTLTTPEFAEIERVVKILSMLQTC